MKFIVKSIDKLTVVNKDTLEPISELDCSGLRFTINEDQTMREMWIEGKCENDEQEAFYQILSTGYFKEE